MRKGLSIDGRWIESAATETVRNPWNGEPLAEFCLADAALVETAIATSHAAFSKTRSQPAWERSKTLTKIADLIQSRRDEFVRTIVAEAGKPLAPAEGEVDRATMTFRFAAQLALADEGHGIRMDGSPQGAGHFGLVRRFPIGVILGITPFNFPLNLVAHKVAPAIASGNTIVVKPSPRTPLSSLLLAEVIHEAGAIPGQVNVAPFSHEFVGGLLADPRIRMLSFTGSAPVGWKLKSEAVKMKVALELGGNAAVIVEPDSDWRAAIPGIASGAFSYAGQSCISVQRIFVHASCHADFREAFVDYVREKIFAGNPESRDTVIGPMIDAAARDRVVAWVNEAVAGGATLLTPLKTEGTSLLHPIVLENAPASSAVVCQEAFAPLAVIGKYDDFAEAIRAVNDSAFGLQAGVFTRDISKAFAAFETLDVGGVMINQVPTFRVENMPYGGVKDSGFGREGVRYAMEEMTEPRSLVVKLG